MNRKHAIFNRPEWNETFRDVGFIVVPFFDLAELNNAFQELKKRTANKWQGHQNENVQVSYHSTFLDSDRQHKALIFEELEKFFAPFLHTVFNDYKMVQANVFNKPAGKGYVCPHQNLTIVNEEHYTSVSIWCPLQDTTSHNGTLHLLPRSHGKFEKFRSSELEWPLWNSFENTPDMPMLQPVNIKAGEVLIMDDSIIHSSPDNLSDADRFVFHALAVPREAPLIFPKVIGDKAHIYRVYDDFYQFYTPGQSPTLYQELDLVPYLPKSYTAAEIIKVCGA